MRARRPRRSKAAVALAFALLALLASPTVAATFYIDPSAPSNGNGTQASPYNTWTSVTFGAGNTYLQKAGTTYNSQLWVGGVNASAASPITLDGYGAGANPTIHDIYVSGNMAYWTFQHLRVQNGVVYDLHRPTDHLTWQFDDVSNPSMHAFYIQGPSTNNLVQNNKIHDAPGVYWCMVLGATGHVSGNGDQVLNNEIYNCGGYGIEIYYSSWNTVRSNVVHDTGQNKGAGGSGMHQYNGGFGTPFGTTECHHNTWDKNVVWNAYDHNGDGNGLQIDQSCHDNNVTKNSVFWQRRARNLDL